MRQDAADTADEDDGHSLYEKIVALTGIEFDLEAMDAETYKQQIVAWYSPSDRAVGDKRYEAAPREVQDWVDDATKVARANKSARRKQPLPAIDGLPETDGNEDEEDEVAQTQTKSRRSARTEDEDEADEKPTRRGARAQNENDDEDEKPSRRSAGKSKTAAKAKPKASKKAAANGEAKEGRDPTNNCYGHVFRLMLKNPKQSLEQVIDKLNRDGMEYSEHSVGRVYGRAQIFISIAKEMGQIEA